MVAVRTFVLLLAVAASVTASMFPVDQYVGKSIMARGETCVTISVATGLTECLEATTTVTVTEYDCGSSGTASPNLPISASPSGSETSTRTSSPAFNPSITAGTSGTATPNAPGTTMETMPPTIASVTPVTSPEAPSPTTTAKSVTGVPTGSFGASIPSESPGPTAGASSTIVETGVPSSQTSAESTASSITTTTPLETTAPAPVSTTAKKSSTSTPAAVNSAPGVFPDTILMVLAALTTIF